MKLFSRCLPTGALPYDSIEAAVLMQAKLFEKMPYLCFLPKVNPEDTLKHRSFDKIFGIKIKDKNVILKLNTESHKKKFVHLNTVFNEPTEENLLEFAFDAPLLKKYFSLIKKFKPNNACFHFYGPFSMLILLQNQGEQQLPILEKDYRKLLIQSICLKAIWLIKEIKKISPETIPLIILEEPYLNKLGDLKRDNEKITDELVTNMLAKIVEKLKQEGADVGVQSFEKCNWLIPINAGVDMISFDAFNNPDNLSIIPDAITEFISRGGKINWAIVPVTNENTIKSYNLDKIEKKLFTAFESLITSGVSEKFVYNSSSVSINGDVDKMPIFFAEKAIMLANHLSKKIPVKS